MQDLAQIVDILRMSMCLFQPEKKVILLNLQPFCNVEMFPVVTNTELQDCKINSFQSVSNF